jgi:predicted ATPase
MGRSASFNTTLEAVLLRELEIANYRSLEHVKLEKIDRFNVLIGRNNAGKSSVFGAVAHLSQGLRGEGINWEAILTGNDPTRALVIRLLFSLSEAERRKCVDLTGVRLSPERRQQLYDSPFLRQGDFEFTGAPRSQLLHLRRTRIIAEDNEWATVHEVDANDLLTPNPGHRGTVLEQVATSDDILLNAARLSIGGPSPQGRTRITLTDIRTTQAFGPPLAMLFERLNVFLTSSFFFNPFRHSTARLQVSADAQLGQEGSNLARVLHTINSNDRDLFNRIEAFVQSALPNVGKLQTPLTGNHTEVQFRTDAGYSVRLHDMGGGVEQLLMVATVLLTTTDESPLFVEEPESHLHPGAQRFLIEQLHRGQRQIFVTTHSPTFVNLPHKASLYQVRLGALRTRIDRVGSPEALGAVLDDIGSRNSDVLLSDAILFVEGSSDEGAFRAWSDTIGASLDEHNVTLLPTGGSEQAGRNARLRSDLLTGLSRKTGVPHLFVIDRDERSAREVRKLRDELGDRVHVLERREIENYLLAPRAIVAAMRSKYRDDAEISKKLEEVDEARVQDLIDEIAGSLYGLILLKRIRTELPGLSGGILSRETAASLSDQADNPDLAKLLISEKAALDAEWASVSDRRSIAPGEEILERLFEAFGGTYKKPQDTRRIAREMRKSDVAAELVELIERAARLAVPPGGAIAGAL